MSVCLSQAILSAMGLGPALPAYGFLCNPYLGKAQSAGVGGCQPGVPCCAGIPLSDFNPLPYPIPAGGAQIVFSNPAIFNPPNTSNITNDADLLSYLNTEVLPLLVPPSYTVEGVGSQWSIVGGIVHAPKVNGTCEQVMSPIIGLAPTKPTEPVISPPPAEPQNLAPVETVEVVTDTENHAATAPAESQPVRNKRK